MTGVYEKLLEETSLIEDKIGYVFQNKHILALAFVHRSFFNENRTDTPDHNERLEFLGDSVLDLLISEYLYLTFPEEPEGQLSYLRAVLVDAATCAKFVQKLSLTDFILLGKGERMQEGASKESIQADLFEAILAAVYLDGGLEPSKKFFWSHFEEEIAGYIAKPAHNWKAKLQEAFQKEYQKLPVYRVLSEQGPDHNKNFEVGVFLEDVLLGSGSGSSKKEAEQNAAEKAFHQRPRGEHGKD